MRIARLEIFLGIMKLGFLRERSQRGEQAEVLPEKEKGRDSMGRCSDQMDVVSSLNEPEKACWPWCSLCRGAKLRTDAKDKGGEALKELGLELDELSRP